ncbi:MAG: disulfide bond formation protein B [Candidatus Puniceispirillales bacterium]
MLQKIQPSQALVLLGLGSGGLLGAALVFQYGFGLWPCTLCLWQRWPHWLMLGLAGLALFLGPWAVLPLMLLAVLALLTTAGIALWHSGVEWGVLPGPSACSGGLSLDGDPAAVLDAMLAGSAPRCDEVPWSFLGLSMANWNAVISLAMAAVAAVMLVRLIASRKLPAGAS